MFVCDFHPTHNQNRKFRSLSVCGSIKKVLLNNRTGKVAYNTAFESI